MIDFSDKAAARSLLKFFCRIGIGFLILLIIPIFILSFNYWRYITFTSNVPEEEKLFQEPIQKKWLFSDDVHLISQWWYQKNPGESWKIVVALFNTDTWDKKVAVSEVVLFDRKRGRYKTFTIMTPEGPDTTAIIKALDVKLFYFDATSDNKQIGIFKNSVQNCNLLTCLTIPGKAVLESIIPFQYIQKAKINDIISLCIDNHWKTGIYVATTKDFLLVPGKETELTYYFTIPRDSADFILYHLEFFNENYLRACVKFDTHFYNYFPFDSLEAHYRNYRRYRQTWFTNRLSEQLDIFDNLFPHPPVVSFLPPFHPVFPKAVSQGKIEILNFGGAIRSDSVSDDIIKESWFDYGFMANGKIDSLKLLLRVPEFVPGATVWMPYLTFSCYSETGSTQYLDFSLPRFFVRAKEPYKKSFLEAIYGWTLGQLTYHSFIIILDSLLLIGIALTIWRWRRRRKLRAKS